MSKTWNVSSEDTRNVKKSVIFFVIEKLAQERRAFTVVFYNPNIYPFKEYEIRKNELISYCKKNNIDFYIDEYYIKDLFKKSLSDKKRLEALFVSESGHSSEKLLGIITHWDLDK